MTTRHLLFEHLHQLEQQAATVAALIDFDDEDLVQQVVDAWAPVPNGYQPSKATRDRWRRMWLAWLLDCGDRWEQRPPEHPAGEDVADLLLAWARRT